MPNEIYHRSNWGESKAEDFGDVYYDHAATNKLYNHSDYYENSDGTDATLKDLNNKASIVLTPTAYSDGSLNTVIPPYQLLSELVTNGSFDTDSDWSKSSQSTISGGKARILSTDGSFQYIKQSGYTSTQGKMVKVTVNVTDVQGGQIRASFSGGNNTAVIPSSLGEQTGYLVNNGTIGELVIGRVSGVTDISIDNVSVKEIQEADFDFSRGSSATRVNEQGLVEDVQILSGELVQNGNFEQIGAEEVTNGNFETDSDWIKGTGWSISDGKAIATSTNGSLYQANDFVSGKSYKITFQITSYESGGLICRFNNDETNIFNSVGTHTLYFKSDNSFDYVYFLGDNSFTGSIDNVSVKEVGQNWTFTNANISNGVVNISTSGDLAGIVQSSVTTSGKLYEFSIDITDIETLGQGISLVSGGLTSTILHTFTTVGTHTVNFTATSTTVGIKRKSGATDITIDNISVVEVTNDTDLPRIDFTDGTGSLLLEPQRTNLVTYSEDFSDSSWTKLGAGTGSTAIVTSDYATSPDGTQNASRLQCDLNGGTTISDQSLIYDTISGSGDTSAFVYAKSNTSSNQTFYLANALNDRISAVATTEWKKFELNWNASSNGRSFSIGTRGTTGSDDTLDLLIWGAQVEAGSYATSYIPTSGSTVTRSADVANNSGNADLFNDSEGVLYSDISFLAPSASANNQLSLSDGSSDNRIMIYPLSNTQLGLRFNANGSQLVTQAVTVSSLIAYSKIAIKWGNGNYSLYQNGSEIYTQTIASTPIGLDKLNLSSVTGTSNLKANVKCVAVFKEALSNDLLERLTGEGYESFRLLAEANNYTII